MQWRRLSSLQHPPPGSRVAGITGVHHNAQLTFVFLVEMGFHHVGQAGFELLTSGDPSPSASKMAGITNVSRHACPKSYILAGIKDFLGSAHKSWTIFVDCGSNGSLIFRVFAVLFGLLIFSGSLGAPTGPCWCDLWSGKRFPGGSWWEKDVAESM